MLLFLRLVCTYWSLPLIKRMFCHRILFWLLQMAQANSSSLARNAFFFMNYLLRVARESRNNLQGLIFLNIHEYVKKLTFFSLIVFMVHTMQINQNYYLLAQWFCY